MTSSFAALSPRAVGVFTYDVLKNYPLPSDMVLSSAKTKPETLRAKVDALIAAFAFTGTSPARLKMATSVAAAFAKELGREETIEVGSTFLYEGVVIEAVDPLLT